jgi:hypothetical protein
MFKMSMILAVFLITQAPVNAPRQRGTEQDHTTHDANGTDSNGPPIPQPTVKPRSSSQETDGEQKHNPTDSKPNYWKEAFGPTLLSNWALVLVGAVAGLFAWLTLRRISDQAETMHKSTQISVDAERAWIVDSTDDLHQLPQFTEEINASITLSNRGRVTARIVDLKMVLKTINRDDWPKVPEYDSEQIILEIGASGLIVAPGQSSKIPISLIPALSQRDRQMLTDRGPYSKRLVLYGRAKYNDGFTENRFTQFCYTWEPVSGNNINGSGRFRRVGPADYNDAT